MSHDCDGDGGNGRTGITLDQAIAIRSATRGPVTEIPSKATTNLETILRILILAAPLLGVSVDRARAAAPHILAQMAVR